MIKKSLIKKTLEYNINFIIIFMNILYNIYFLS